MVFHYLVVYGDGCLLILNYEALLDLKHVAGECGGVVVEVHTHIQPVQVLSRRINRHKGGLVMSDDHDSVGLK